MAFEMTATWVRLLCGVSRVEVMIDFGGAVRGRNMCVQTRGLESGNLHAAREKCMASTYLDMMAGAAVSADAFGGRGILNTVIAMTHTSGKTGGGTRAWEGGD